MALKGEIQMARFQTNITERLHCRIFRIHLEYVHNRIHICKTCMYVHMFYLKGLKQREFLFIFTLCSCVLVLNHGYVFCSNVLLKRIHISWFTDKLMPLQFILEFAVVLLVQLCSHFFSLSLVVRFMSPQATRWQ